MNPGHPLAQSGHGTVSRGLAQTVLDTLDDSALPAVQALRTQLADPTAAPAMTQLESLLDACTQVLGADCGLILGARARPATFSALGYLVMSSRTLGEAIAQMPTYESVVMTTGLTTLQHDGEQIHLNWLLRDQPPHPVLEDFILAAWLNLGRWLVGHRLSPAEVRFSHATPANPQIWQQTFGCPVVFGCHTAGVRFPAAWLDWPVLHADPDLHALMQERARAMLAAQPVTGQWSRQVLALLPDLLLRQEATLTVVAERLQTSARSLRRRLAEEGTGFTELLQEQRRQLARHYLRDNRLSLLDIALLLGYAEHSAFSAAFRQWYGVTPQQFRGGQAL